MKYTFLENKFDSKYNKYKLFEYDQFDEEEDYEEDDVDNIDQEKVIEINYRCTSIDELYHKMLDNNISAEDKEKYIKVNKKILNDKFYDYKQEPLLFSIVNKYYSRRRDEVYEYIRLFVENGYNIDTKAYDGETILFRQVYYERVDLVFLLLKLGANPNIKSNINDYGRLHHAITPLFFMSIKEPNEIRTIIADLLIRFGKADPNIQQDYTGLTPLMKTVFYNNIEMAKLLLEHGANPNIKDKYGNTALKYAKEKDNTDIINLLLEYGAKE